MKGKSKHFIIQILTIFIFVLLILVLIKINIFMESYETCKDDFKVIEQCKCLPHEGDYTYFKEMYDLDDEINPLYGDINGN